MRGKFGGHTFDDQYYAHHEDDPFSDAWPMPASPHKAIPAPADQSIWSDVQELIGDDLTTVREIVRRSQEMALREEGGLHPAPDIRLTRTEVAKVAWNDRATREEYLRKWGTEEPEVEPSVFGKANPDASSTAPVTIYPAWWTNPRQHGTPSMATEIQGVHFWATFWLRETYRRPGNKWEERVNRQGLIQEVSYKLTIEQVTKRSDRFDLCRTLLLDERTFASHGERLEYWQVAQGQIRRYFWREYLEGVDLDVYREHRPEDARHASS